MAMYTKLTSSNIHNISMMMLERDDENREQSERASEWKRIDGQKKNAAELLLSLLRARPTRCVLCCDDDGRSISRKASNR